MRVQSDETLFITFWNNVCSPTSERALLADLSMTSRCGVACILIAAAVSTFAMTAIISAVTAESDSPTGELGTDPNHVYHAHTGLCKSKSRAHSFAGHSHSTRIVYLPAPAELASAQLCIISAYRRLRADCADYTIEEQSVCQTICDWNASCAAYEWGAGCYVSSVWGFVAPALAPRRARDPRAPAPSPPMTMFMNMTAGRARGTVRKGAGV